jgi:hypothetical protein
MGNDAESQHAAADLDERARALYWNELVQLKHEAEYVRRYRDRLDAILTWFDIGRAVISVGALGSWVGGLGLPKVWGSVIVISQVAEAVMAKLPLTARQKGLAAFGHALDAMLIDALLEWEDIQADRAGGLDTIVRRWHRLMTLRHEAEQAHLPGGLPFKSRLFRLADQDGITYLNTRYGRSRKP